MKRAIFSIIISLFLICSVSAEVIIGKLQPVYNRGDSLITKITISPSIPKNDYFNAELQCNEKSISLYRSPLNVGAGQQKEIEINAKLDSKVISNLEGACLVRVDYAGETAQSTSFEISKYISLTLDVDRTLFDPGTSVNIRGKAVKKNGQNLNGFAEISIAEMGISLSVPVISGVFSTNFSIPARAGSGSYTINVKAYEKDLTESIINEGTSTAPISVRQVIDQADIAFNSQSIKPGEILQYNTILLDQAGKEINQEVTVSFSSPDQKIIKNEIVKTSETNNFLIGYNYTPGYWDVALEVGNLQAKKQFYIEEYENISMVLINNTLVVLNTGNIPFNKPVKILIGGVEKLISELKLPIGGTKKFRLTAPPGDYTVEYSIGKMTVPIGSMTGGPTGRAISVEDFDSLLQNKSFIWIWVIVIMILALIAVYLFLYLRKIKKSYIGKMPPKFVGSNIPIQKPNATPPNVAASPQTETKTTGKDESVVLSLKIKNFGELSIENSPAMDTIQRALIVARDSKAKIYMDGDFRIIVFSPLIIQDDRVMIALKTANDIQSILLEHNKKYGQKIDFGIGINVGDLIAENVGGNLKFTSWGNAIPLAKTISGYAENEMLVSEDLRLKVLGKIRVEQLPEKNYFRVTKLMGQGNQQSEFIRRFTERQQKG